jgi:hypothetical protein
MQSDEVTLQSSLECVPEVHHRHAWTAVQEQDDGLGAIVATNENPLLDSPDLVFV